MFLLDKPVQSGILEKTVSLARPNWPKLISLLQKTDFSAFFIPAIAFKNYVYRRVRVCVFVGLGGGSVI